MWTISYTFGSEFFFTRNINISPASTNRKNCCFRFQNSSIFKLHFNQILFLNVLHTLVLHDINWIFLGMFFYLRHQLRSFCIRRTNHIFDTDSLHHLSTKSFNDHTCTNSLTSSINSCAASCRSAPNNQHIKWFFFVKFFT